MEQRPTFFARLDSFNRPFWAWSIVLGFFLISIAGLVYSPFEELSAKIANRNYNGEGFIELIEAFFWLSAFFVFVVLLIKSMKEKRGYSISKLWLLFFVALTFVAFGEEISWGQHIFGFDPPNSIEAINKQKEFNFHNLNISKIVGLDVNDGIYRYFQNFNSILNPLFYVVCGLLWFVFPLMKKNKSRTLPRFIDLMPAAKIGTVIFCGINMALYLVVDKLFFDIGEILELSLSLTAIMYALDVCFESINQDQLSRKALSPGNTKGIQPSSQTPFVG